MHDEEHLKNIRGFASRHENIGPTPRDTMAVLRAAAEQTTHESPASRAWRSWAFALASLAILISLGLWLRAPEPPAIAQEDEEFEVFWTEMNDHLASIGDDEPWIIQN